MSPNKGLKFTPFDYLVSRGFDERYLEQLSLEEMLRLAQRSAYGWMEVA